MSTSRHLPGAGSLPAGVQCSTFWIDESGSKTTATKCFVVAGIKTRHADDLLRAIHSVREKHNHYQELKFGRLSSTTYKVFADIVDVLEDSDAHVVATVVDQRHNPFKGKESWRAHAGIVTQLVVGNVNRNEVATVLMDGISTPPGKSLGAAVKRGVNSRLGSTTVTSAISLDSKSNDLLQAADLVAGAIFHQRMSSHRTAAPKAEKVRIAGRLALAFGVQNLDDGRSDRVNIMTMRGRSPRRSNVRELAKSVNAS